MEKYKEKLLNKLKSHIDFIRQKIREKLEISKIMANKSLKELSRMNPEDQMVYMNLRANAETRVAELTHLESSPYFIKCKIIDEIGEEKDYFFSKHQFSEESIFSWVAPVATIRFEKPGKTSYRLPDGTERTVIIKQKEQYMIVNGKVIFFAVEDGEKPRELIYQEHFTKQKTDFALPEIVAQIEKAQDQVIRAEHRGPLVIAGPAGSGKTTLALHRVAYLTQAPDTSLFYPAFSIVVFVQDMGTKKYFSTLLPGLGINDVEITTFSEWAMSILRLEGYIYVERYGDNEEERDMYEYKKLKALRQESSPSWNRNIYKMLDVKYIECLSPNDLKLFNKQKREKKLDRFDLIILLNSYFKKFNKLETQREYQTFIKDKLVRKVKRTRIMYSMMVIDEFQNYLPEQLNILKNCLSKETESVIYVGDMAQQVKLGTIKDWNEIKESIHDERKIQLKKVYRNTKNILSYIQSLGYKIEIPIEVKEGPAVVELVTESKEEEINHIKKHISKYKEGSIGILSREEEWLEDFRKEFENDKNIHVLSMLEAQGVEFDIVFIVGISNESFKINHEQDSSIEHIDERKRMQKDLLYVALTRAISELHILGKDKLGDVIMK